MFLMLIVIKLYDSTYDFNDNIIVDSFCSFFNEKLEVMF